MKKNTVRTYITLQYSSEESFTVSLSTRLLRYSRRVIRSTLQEVGLHNTYALNILITNNEGIQKLNRNFRQKDVATDVLSFPSLYAPLVNVDAECTWMIKKNMDTTTTTGKILFIGDIAVSWEIVATQSQANNQTPLIEYLYLLSHAVLHLVGYDDQTLAGYHAMVAIQNKVLGVLNCKEW